MKVKHPKTMSAGIIAFILAALFVGAALITGGHEPAKPIYFVGVGFALVGLVLLIVADLWKASSATSPKRGEGTHER